MQLGLFTACLPRLTLDEVAEWATSAGYDSLEVAAWPSGGDHPHHATHIEVDRGPVDAGRITALLAEHGLAVSAVSCYENNLIGDPAERRRIHDHLKACIRAASALGVPHVGTFVGRDAGRTVADNLREAEKVLPELVRYADDHGVRLVVENCPMEGWHPDGYPGNLAYSPERYRVPGRGQLDWVRIVDTFYTGGFDGAVAVEHEDPVWGGTDTKIKQGLEIAAETLRPLIR